MLTQGWRANRRLADPPSRRSGWKLQRLEAVGSEAPRRQRGRGWIRSLLALGAGAWVLAQLRPWHRIEVIRQAGGASLAAAVTPSGKALALWRDEQGGWYEVNARGELRQVDPGQAQARLDLPRLAGVSPVWVKKGNRRLLRFELPEGLLPSLLPLERELAPEIESIWLSGSSGDVRLRTHTGTIAYLDRSDFRQSQARLAAVLADLAARRRRAASVDLRFEGTAVVRLASR